ncbi:MAG: ribonuclease III [Caulobacteraceae bacterium]
MTAKVPKDRRKAAAAELERRLGHAFADSDLYERALTHASVGEGARDVRHNERLEFLGDRVLNLLAAERLMGLYPDDREGDLSKRMHGLINREACASVARRIGLGEALRLAGGESRRGGREQTTILADACEALLAALYLDAGLERTREIFADIWADEFEAVGQAGVANPKSELQEWAASKKLPQPSYFVTDRSGPDHAPTFTVELTVGDLERATGQGRSRQEAEKAAATAMLARETKA